MGGPQALTHSLASGGPKVQWNGAAAACRLLGNVPVAAALPDAVATVVQAATALLQSSGNLKASTQVFASIAFSVRDHRKSLFFCRNPRTASVCMRWALRDPLLFMRCC